MGGLNLSLRRNDAKRKGESPAWEGGSSCFLPTHYTLSIPNPKLELQDSQGKLRPARSESLTKPEIRKVREPEARFIM